MAKVKITGHASGTGILTVTAPNTSTDRTITLPDATGILLNSDGSGANLTNLPADSTKLPLAGGTMTGHITGGDNIYLKLGAGDDLQLHHDGSNSYIVDDGTGDLILRGTSNIKLQNGTGEAMLTATSDGSIELYENNVKKLETTATGINVTGAITADTDLTRHTQFQDQYNGTTTGTITLTCGFEPKVVILLFTVGSGNVMSVGYSRKAGATSSHECCVQWQEAQSGTNNWGFNDASIGKLAHGSDQVSYLDVTAWGSNDFTMTKRVDSSGSSSTCRYMALALG